MSPEFRQKKLESSLGHLVSSGLPHGDPLVLDLIRTSQAQDSKDSGAGATMFSIPLKGSLESFDIALMNTGLMALREYDPALNSWKVIAYQGNPGHLVDLANDMLVGCRCSHLVETKPRVH